MSQSNAAFVVSIFWATLNFVQCFIIIVFNPAGWALIVGIATGIIGYFGTFFL